MDAKKMCGNMWKGAMWFSMANCNVKAHSEGEEAVLLRGHISHLQKELRDAFWKLEALELEKDAALNKAKAERQQKEAALTEARNLSERLKEAEENNQALKEENRVLKGERDGYQARLFIKESENSYMMGELRDAKERHTMQFTKYCSLRNSLRYVQSEFDVSKLRNHALGIMVDEKSEQIEITMRSVKHLNALLDEKDKRLSVLKKSEERWMEKAREEKRHCEDWRKQHDDISQRVKEVEDQNKILAMNLKAARKVLSDKRRCEVEFLERNPVLAMDVLLCLRKEKKAKPKTECISNADGVLVCHANYKPSSVEALGENEDPKPVKRKGKRRRVKCWQCGRKGHHQRDCWFRTESER